jgi:DNA ligase-1
MALDHDGDTAEVQGSGSKPYQLKNSGGVKSCSCPAWRNQSVPIDKRTCKHLRKVCGDAAETARIGGISAVGITTGRLPTSAPNLSNAPRAASGNGNPVSSVALGEPGWEGKSVESFVNHCRRAGMDFLMQMRPQIEEMAEKELGRKLRQDEKAKFFGPPILLAHPFEEADISPKGWWMSEKLDGVRAYWDGKQFISRQGNIFYAPDWFRNGLPDHPLDGELWMGRHAFQQTISVVKSVDSGDRWKKVCYRAFDMPHLTLEGFEKRMELLEGVLKHRHSDFFKMVDQNPCLGLDHLKQELDRLVALGAEGVMIREPKSRYVAARSATILKVKPWKDAEATVIGYEAGKGRHKGRTGGLEVRTPEGIEFNLGGGLTDEDRRNPPPIGSVVTYRYMDKTDAGKPKGASFIAVRDYE